jgi:hypothetical protein
MSTALEHQMVQQIMLEAESQRKMSVKRERRATAAERQRQTSAALERQRQLQLSVQCERRRTEAERNRQMSAALEEKRHRQLSEQRKLRHTEAEHQRQMSAALVRTEANEAERKRVKKNEANRKYRTLKQHREQNIKAGLSSAEQHMKAVKRSEMISRQWRVEKERKATNNKRNYGKRQYIKSTMRMGHGLIMATALYQQRIVERNMEDYIRRQISIKERYDRCRTGPFYTFIDIDGNDHDNRSRTFYDRREANDHDKTMMGLSEIEKNRRA